MSSNLHTVLYTKADRTYDFLKRGLLEGMFAYKERLAEERLAAAAGTSRTPVREALRRLATEGFVEAHPMGGFQPRVPDLVRIHELYEVRTALERLAVKLAAANPRRELYCEPLLEDWEVLRDAPPAPDAAFVHVDESFHMGIAQASENATLAEHLHQVNEQIRVVRMRDFLTEDRIERTIEEHIEICRLVLQSEANAAWESMRRHLAVSTQIVEERAAQVLARMLTDEISRP